MLSFAIASTSPVCASSTTADAFLAPEAFFGLRHRRLHVPLDIGVDGQPDGFAIDGRMHIAGASRNHRPSEPRS